MHKQFETPILFLIFNRPSTSYKVFERIREVKPQRLYIAADGPRPDVKEDEKQCLESRKILQLIDWPCEVKTLYREYNLGCGIAVSSAITWFFEQEEQGIIIEDDCLPSISFFCFCEQMLNKYKLDKRVWHIAGYNTQNGKRRGDGDYYFSQESTIWGWATWRRSWQYFNFKITSFTPLTQSRLKYCLKKSRLQSISAMYDFGLVHQGNRKDIWDYNYAFYQLVNSGLTIIPNYNLIENIGFGDEATHTKKQKRDLKANPALEIDFTSIKHPTFVIVDTIADAYTYKQRTKLTKKIYVYLEDKVKSLF